jgi:hypothetical protein
MGSVAMEASIPCPLFPYYFPKLGISMDFSQKQTINFLKEKSWETELIDASYHVLTSFVFYVLYHINEILMKYHNRNKIRCNFFFANYITSKFTRVTCTHVYKTLFQMQLRLIRYIMHLLLIT